MTTFPRKFTYNRPEGFYDSTKYILLFHDGSSARETLDGEIVNSGRYWKPEYIDDCVKRGAWKEVFPEQPKAKCFLHAERGAFGTPPEQLYYVALVGDECHAVNADGTTQPLPDILPYLKIFEADGRWKEVDEATAKAALKPAPKVRRFQSVYGAFGPHSNPYHFEIDAAGEGWWVYEDGKRVCAGVYYNLENALKDVEAGNWAEIGTNVPPAPETKTPVVPKCSDFYVVGRKFGPFTSHGSEESATLAATGLAKNTTFPIYVLKPVKVFTLVQSAPTVEEKTL